MKDDSIHGLDKIPDKVLLKKSREEVGELKSEIEFLEAEVQRLTTDIHTKRGFKLSSQDKIEVRTNERVELLKTRNKKLSTENKKLKRDNGDLIYKLVQLQKQK